MENIASNVIAKFGGAEVVAEIVNRHPSNVHRWTYPKERGGTGGIIPAQHQNKLLQAAPAYNVDLKPKDFFPTLTDHSNGRAGGAG